MRSVNEEGIRLVRSIVRREGPKIGLTELQKNNNTEIEVLHKCTGGEIYICRIKNIMYTVSVVPGAQSVRCFGSITKSK